MKKLLLITALLTMMLSLLASPASGNHVEQAQPRIAVRFLPTNFRRLCVGDTLTLNIWTHWEQNPDAEPPLAPLEPNPSDPPANDAPASPGLSITAQLGTVTPGIIDGVFLTGDHYFQVNYEAVNPGTETVEVVLYGDLASGTRTFEVLDHCDYEMHHIGVYTMRMADDDLYMTDDAVFTSEGEFSVNRTSGEYIELSGSGNRSMVRTINFTSTEYVCDDIPRTLTGSASIDISGTMSLPPLASISPFFDFSPIIIPVESLEIYCHDNDGGDGFGSPLQPHVIDGKVEEDTPMLFPIDGGSITINKSVPASPGATVFYTTTIHVQGK